MARVLGWCRRAALPPDEEQVQPAYLPGLLGLYRAFHRMQWANLHDLEGGDPIECVGGHRAVH